MFGVLKAVGHCPFVTCVRVAEGCGLLADGQTCLQLTTRGYASNVQLQFEALPLVGSLHQGR